MAKKMKKKAHGPLVGSVSAETIGASKGLRLDAKHYLDECVHCGAQRLVASNRFGVWQHHPDDGRCCRYVKALEFKGTTFEQRGETQSISQEPREPPVPGCEFCESPAEFLAAQSDDGGKEVEWVRVCRHHADGWNDNSDWYAPIYQFGGPVAEIARTICEHEIDITTVRHADGTDDIIDVWCKKCGKSGSFALEASDVMWD